MACLHPISWKNGWIFSKPTSKLLRHGKELIKFWWPWPHFQGHRRAQIVGKKLFCTISPGWMDGFWLNLHIYIVVTWKKNWLDFGDLDPIFKVTQGLRLLKNGLSAPYLMKEWMDFDQTCTAILLRQGKNWLDFWWPWLYFQGHRRAQIVGKGLFCTLSPEWIDGFWPNMYCYIVETATQTD